MKCIGDTSVTNLIRDSIEIVLRVGIYNEKIEDIAVSFVGPVLPQKKYRLLLIKRVVLCVVISNWDLMREIKAQSSIPA